MAGICNKIVTITMIIFLGTLFLFFLVQPDRAFSEMENRILQQIPVFSWPHVSSGQFARKAENYVTDQFAFREGWVSVKSEVERMLQKKDHNGVYFGRDGYLLQKPEPIDQSLLMTNLSALNEFALGQEGKIYLLLAPVSAQIMHDKLPGFAKPHIIDLQEVKKQINKKVACIDTMPILTDHKNEEIYYRTDHHWTTKGAYYAYQTAGQVMGFTPRQADRFTVNEVCNDFYGTLYSKSGGRKNRPDSIALYQPKTRQVLQVEYVYENRISGSLYDLQHLEKRDKYAVFLDGNHALITIKTENKTGRTLLVIKDSYANSFIPFLTGHYDEIHLMDLRFFNSDIAEYIRQNRLHEILFVYNTVTFAEERSLRKLI